MGNRCIALVGFMGSGKSSVGRLLAMELGRPFVDLDRCVEQIAQMSIPDLFRAQGEVGFRAIETNALNRVKGEDGVVLATGGGIITTAENRERLSADWVCVYLKARPRTVIERLEQDPTPRPLLQGHDREQRIQALMDERALWYEQVSDLSVHVDALSVPEIVAQIVSELDEGDSSCST